VCAFNSYVSNEKTTLQLLLRPTGHAIQVKQNYIEITKHVTVDSL